MTDIYCANMTNQDETPFVVCGLFNTKRTLINCPQEGEITILDDTGAQ